MNKKEFKKLYKKKLIELQIQLVKLQDYIIEKGERVVIIFEGRDAAGKGGAIKRIIEKLNPRYCKVVALSIPTEKEKTQWYFQRYISHFPSAGEIIIFDRSWYNRAGVEKVMDFCSKEEYEYFLNYCPIFEKMIINSGIKLMKFWFSVSAQEQIKRFQDRSDNPTKGWKLSPMDLESVGRWDDYSKAKDEMFKYTDTKYAPWYIVESDNKKKARINCINHILKNIEFDEMNHPEIILPKQRKSTKYKRPERDNYNYVSEIL